MTKHTYPPRSPGRRKHDGILIPALIATTTALLVCLITLLLLQAASNRLVEGLDAEARDRDLLACDSNNVFRGYVLYVVPRDSDRRPIAEALFHLRDCEKSIARNKTVLVPNSVERSFVEVLARGQRPIVRGGRVVVDGS